MLFSYASQYKIHLPAPAKIIADSYTYADPLVAFKQGSEVLQTVVPAVEPEVLMRMVPKGRLRSSEMTMRFSRERFSFCSQYLTALPLKFMYVDGFKSVK